MTKDPREVFKREAEKKLSKNGFVGFSKKGEGTTRIMGSAYKVKTESTDKIFHGGQVYRREKVPGGVIYRQVSPLENPKRVPVLSWTRYNPVTDTMEYGQRVLTSKSPLADWEKKSSSNYVKEEVNSSDAIVYMRKGHEPSRG